MHMILMKGDYIKKMKKWFKFLILIFSPTILLAITIFLTYNDIYLILNKPLLSPFYDLFAILFFPFFILMGISFYIIYYDKYHNKVQMIYYLQLICSLIWFSLFYTFNLYLISTIWIILLVTLVTNMLLKFYNLNKVACLLNLPYLFWLLYVFYLNLGIYILN